MAILQDNLSESSYAYWAAGVQQGAPAESTHSWVSDFQLGQSNRVALGQPVCVAANLPISGLWVGLLLDWIADGSEDAGVSFVGFENVTNPFTADTILAQHWQKAGKFV